MSAAPENPMSVVPEVSIVIAAYNAAKTIPKVLEACRAQDLPKPWEVIVVDDGSTDDTSALAARGGARVLSQENRGPAAARNHGWRSAKAPVILFTDSDCVPHRDWARLLSGGLDDTYSAACGTYGIANPGHWLAETIHAEIRWRHSRLPESVDFAGSYNLAATRTALESIGGFDDSYRAPSGEDNDLSYRLRDTGHEIRFVPSALVDHHHPTNLWRYLKEQARHGRWRMRLYASHRHRVRGDMYAGGGDLASPPLAMFSLFALAVSLFFRPALLASGLAFMLVSFFHLLLAAQVAVHARHSVPLLLAPVGILRAYVRGFGMIRGMIDIFGQMWRR
jgi:glycosyltransferase involved in cell wall biosynthesis